MTMKKHLFDDGASLAACPRGPVRPGQGRRSEELLKPLGESWPTHSGDYTGRRYSALKQINRTNVKNLTLAWVTTLSKGRPSGVGGRGGGAAAGRGGA